jgi:hypothetical protein
MTRSKRIALAVLLVVVSIVGTVAVLEAAHDGAQRHVSQSPTSAPGYGAGVTNAQAARDPFDLANRAIRQRADGLGLGYTSSSCDKIRPDEVGTVSTPKLASVADQGGSIFVCHVADQSANQDDFTATGFGPVSGTACVVAVYTDGETNITNCK